VACRLENIFDGLMAAGHGKEKEIGAVKQELIKNLHILSVR
jgi:hypothetical protein